MPTRLDRIAELLLQSLDEAGPMPERVWPPRRTPRAENGVTDVLDRIDYDIENAKSAFTYRRADGREFIVDACTREEADVAVKERSSRSKKALTFIREDNSRSAPVRSFREHLDRGRLKRFIAVTQREFEKRACYKRKANERPLPSNSLAIAEALALDLVALKAHRGWTIGVGILEGWRGHDVHAWFEVGDWVLLANLSGVGFSPRHYLFNSNLKPTDAKTFELDALDSWRVAVRELQQSYAEKKRAAMAEKESR
jgi:hypothetical protein